MAEHDVAGKIHRLAGRKMLGQFDHAVGMPACVQVGAADAAGQRLDQHLPRRRLRLGQVIDDDLAIPENRGPHQTLSHRIGYGTSIAWTPAGNEPATRAQALGDGSPST
jgi:hypothetical protein